MARRDAVVIGRRSRQPGVDYPVTHIRDDNGYVIVPTEETAQQSRFVV
jgi:hypothetical protein